MNTTEQRQGLLVSRDGAVATVTLAREDKRNALGQDFWAGFGPIFDELDRDRDVRAVILDARGDVFCAGLDLSGLMTIPELSFQDRSPQAKLDFLALVRSWQGTIGRLERCRKPVIAAVHGKCVGGGLDLIAACDIRLASRDAVFSLKEAAVAMVADLGSLARLPHIIGQGMTRELAYTAREVSAGEALSMGLVNRVLETRDDLARAARELALEIAAQSPAAVQASKDVLNRARDQSIDEALATSLATNALILPSEDLMEALAAFMERRRPEFRGS